jgi:hypothetical protein
VLVGRGVEDDLRPLALEQGIDAGAIADVEQIAPKVEPRMLLQRTLAPCGRG